MAQGVRFALTCVNRISPRPLHTCAEARTRGVDPASVRVSSQPAALSFVLDPALQTPQAAAGRIERSLGGGVRLTVLRTLGATP